MRIHHPIDAGDREDGGNALDGQLHEGERGAASFREAFDALTEGTPAVDGVSYEKAVVGAVPGWWCRSNDAAAGAAILYLHGGAYVVGSARAYQHFVGQVASRAKAAAFIPEYGLAPEHPLPAAVNASLAAYHGLVANGLTKISLARPDAINSRKKCKAISVGTHNVAGKFMGPVTETTRTDKRSSFQWPDLLREPAATTTRFPIEKRN